MKLKIQKLMGLEDFECDFVAGVPNYVFGGNSAGKTSLATALGALLSQTANPFHLPSGEHDWYVTKGANEGVGSLDGDRVLWADGAISAPGDAPPDASAHAVGVVDFTEFKRGTAARAAVWEEIFLPSEVRALVEPALAGYNATEIEQVVKVIEEEGWVKAQSIYEGHRRAAKSKWGQITNERWGDKKAAEWRPSSWRETLATTSEETLQAALADAQEARNQLMRAEAVSQSEINQARKVRDQDLPVAQERLEKANADLERMRDRRTEAKRSEAEAKAEKDRLLAEWEDIKAVRHAAPPHKCPHCEAGLKVVKGAIEAWQPPAPDEVQKAIDDTEPTREAGREAAKALNAAQANADAVSGTYDKALAEMNQAKAQVELLTKQSAMAGMTSSAGPSQDEVDHAQNRINAANNDILAFRQHNEAQREVGNVRHFDDICKMLGPTGARATIMTKAMNAIRETIKKLGEVADWLPVEILRDYTLVSDGIIMRMAAENEKIKSQWLCQLAAAIVRKSKWVVLDQADRLKFEEWEGLIRMLAHVSSKIPDLRIVVCATDDGTLMPEGWNPIDLQAE